MLMFDFYRNPPYPYRQPDILIFFLTVENAEIVRSILRALKNRIYAKVIVIPEHSSIPPAFFTFVDRS